MTKFLEFIESENGKRVAIPASAVFAVNGREGAVTKIIMKDEKDGRLCETPNQNDENVIRSTSSYDEIMMQLRS